MTDVTWSTRALNDLDSIGSYIDLFDRAAAALMRHRLEVLGNSLGEFPNRGREAARGTREIVTVMPYTLRYLVIADAVLILGIRHGARLSIASA